MCAGGTLTPEVKLISLQIHRLRDSAALASLNIYTNSCITLGDFSSCHIDSADTHRSRLKILVVDLDEGESREYGCVVTTVSSFGNAEVTNLKILVSRKREAFLMCVFVVVTVRCA